MIIKSKLWSWKTEIFYKGLLRDKDLFELLRGNLSEASAGQIVGNKNYRIYY